MGKTFPATKPALGVQQRIVPAVEYRLINQSRPARNFGQLRDLDAAVRHEEVAWEGGGGYRAEFAAGAGLPRRGRCLREPFGLLGLYGRGRAELATDDSFGL